MGKIIKGYVRLIEHYGLDEQIKKLKDKVVELDSYTKKADNSEESINHIVKMLASCELLLIQIREHYRIGITDIKLAKSKEMINELEKIKEKENE